MNIGMTIGIVSKTRHSKLSLDDGSNPHETTKNDIGLGNVDNTPDADKPISTATQTALNAKLSNDISTYTPATTPLVGTEKALIHDGIDFKEVAVSEFAGDLQSVTDNGNSTTNEIVAGNFVSAGSGNFGGVILNDGDLNQIAGIGSLATALNPRSYNFPDKDGTLALEENTIPLSGTKVDKPITGNLQIDPNGYIELFQPANPDHGEYAINKAIYFGADEQLQMYASKGFGSEEDPIRQSNLVMYGHSLYLEQYFYNGVESKSVGFFLQEDLISVSGPLEGTEDQSDTYPTNKKVYAQRSYVDKANSYSTDETLTGGTWIDGKPIYRKVIIWDLSSASMGIPYGVSDLENVVKLESIYKDEFGENFTQLPINKTEITNPALYQSELSLSLNIPDQEIYLRNILAIRPFSTGVTTSQKYTEGGFLYITLEYTKTTD